MSLDNELNTARQEIVKDGYDMSIGELITLYKERELIINPDFQRYFRWTSLQKTKFIESILLRIPIPPIFVFQIDEGTWELVDGLQRLSSLFEFVGILQDSKGIPMPPSILEGTTQLPSLRGKTWRGFTKPQQFDIKRARIRIEILAQGTNANTKFELFQRLNEGGSILTEQEIRTCSMVMANKKFSKWIVILSKTHPFCTMIAQTKDAKNKQTPIELILRFFITRNIPYINGLNVHEYLDTGMLQLAKNKTDVFMETEERIFLKTFECLNDVFGDNIFKKWNGTKFSGKFLVSAYQVISVHVSKHIEAIIALDINVSQKFIKDKVLSLWKDKIYSKHLTSGTNGAMKLSQILPKDFFCP